MQCHYYAVRFLGGSRSCTTGEPNRQTGRMSKAVDIKIFENPTDRKRWIDREDLLAPVGRGAGERIAVTRRELRALCAGMSQKEFDMIEAQISESEEQCTE